jgi:hypothetical protein
MAITAFTTTKARSGKHRSDNDQSGLPGRVDHIASTEKALVSSAFRQQPLQIDEIILAALRSSWSTAASPVPSATPLVAPPVPEDESAVPRELVPGEAGEVPAAPPVVGDE